MARIYRRTLKSWWTWICRLTPQQPEHPHHPTLKCIVLKKLMQLPEACPLSLHSCSHPHSSPPALCECRRCISQSGLLLISHSLIRKGSLSLSLSPSLLIFLSLSLSLLPHPSIALFGGERREGESCSLPEAGCSSLNNSGRLPAVLSPVLHHSITPLHKDVQMGWDAHSHMTLTDTLKQARAHAHAALHAFATHFLRKAQACPDAHKRINAHKHTHVLIKQRWLFGGLPLFPDAPFLLSIFFLQEVKSSVLFFFSPRLCSPAPYSSSLLSFSSHCAPTGG